MSHRITTADLRQAGYQAGPDPMERECAARGLPAPVREHRFHPDRKWRFDYAWPAVKVALEVEGGIWTRGRHTRPKGFLADIEKYNAAAVMGWRVLRCTPETLVSEATVSMLVIAIRAES